MTSAESDFKLPGLAFSRRRPRGLALAAVLVCAPLLFHCLSIGDRSSDLPAEDRELMWMGYYAVARIPAPEYVSLARRLGASPEEIRVGGKDHFTGEIIVRAPAEYAEKLEELGYRPLRNPPFRYVDPDIFARRASRDPADWLQGYLDYDLARRTLQELERRFPERARVVQIGESLEGRGIYALRVSEIPEYAETPENDRPAVLFMAAHHGNEPLTLNYVLDLAYYVLHGYDAWGRSEDDWTPPALRAGVSPAGVRTTRSARLNRFLSSYELWFVPIVNPDGVETFWNRNLWAGRKNARDTTAPVGWNAADGVDLNRNYPFFWNSGDEEASSGVPSSVFYRGAAPATEPEVQAVMRLAAEQRFVLALSYHCYATKVLVPYTIESALNPTPHGAWRYARELAAAGISNRPVKRYVAAKNLYPVDGTDQDWLYHSFGTMAFIVEGSYLHPRFEPFGRRSIQGMRPLSLRALELYLEGPSLSVRVRDARGAPLEARVEIGEYQHFEGERFETHPRTGRWRYLLDGPGTWTVRASRRGYAWSEQRIACERGVCEAELVLEREAPGEQD